jgi:cholesterol transport system auxiliary component
MNGLRAPASVLLLLSTLQVGCALLTKQDVVDVRYFTPDPAPTQTTLTSASKPNGRARLRLGRVTAAGHLRERIAFRDGPHELGFYEDRRWTERPEAYVRRELERRLFDEAALDRTLDPSAPTLDVELLSFEEVRRPGGPFGHVELRVVLHDHDAVIHEETLATLEAASGPSFDALVAALARGLGRLSGRVAARIQTHVARQ